MIQSRRLITIVAIAMAIALAGCGGGGPSAASSDAAIRADDSASADGAADEQPELIADKEIPSACSNALGTGDPAFEDAFCSYREAALTATSGPDGVSGIDPLLLSAGDEAVALFATDPAAALARLESATEALAG